MVVGGVFAYRFRELSDAELLQVVVGLFGVAHFDEFFRCVLARYFEEDSGAAGVVLEVTGYIVDYTETNMLMLRHDLRCDAWYFTFVVDHDPGVCGFVVLLNDSEGEFFHLAKIRGGYFQSRYGFQIPRK